MASSWRTATTRAAAPPGARSPNRSHPRGVLPPYGAKVHARGVSPPLGERERRVLLGHQQDVGLDADLPADHAVDEVEDPGRVAAGEDDREPRDEHAHH